MSNPIEQFDSTYKTLTYAQRQFHFRSLISSYEQSNSPYLDLIYKEYLRRYPFNSYYWNRYAQHVKNTTQSAEESEKIYQYAIQMNPRSYDLWHCYISSVKSDKNDTAEEEKVIKLIEQALQYIGFDYNSAIYWEDLIGFYSENKEELIKLYRRALSIVTKNFDDIYEKYNAFFQFCSPDQIKACFTAILGTQPSEGASQDSMIQQIKNNISNYSDRTKAISQEVQGFESKLTKTEYDGDNNELNTWNQYITFAKAKLAPEQVIFLYEKALISQCDKESLWIEFFHYLESQNQHTIALGICRKQEGFLKYININNLLLQWAELEELYQANEQAREVYKFVVSHEGENYLKNLSRWAQFEKRVSSQVENITEIYERLLSNPSQKPDVQQWAINELCKLLAGSERKQQALVRYIHFFESQTINKVNYAQLLQFVSLYFSQEPNLIETLSEVYVNAINISKKNASELKNIVNMSISHLRTISYNINEIRITEQKIKAAENQQGQANGESLLKKRSIVQLVGEESINGYDSVHKHIKTN
ncbi:hypothetical protein ABPG72_013742 [Tetrahymena utriculariae]